MPHNVHPKVKASRYRQIKVTATQEALGSFSVAVYAKGLNMDWTEHTLLYRQRVDSPPRALLTTDDVLQAVLDMMYAQVLPGIDSIT